MNAMNVTRSVRTLAVAAATALLAACAGPQVDDYARETPKLVLREYFNGPMTAHGVFTDRSGKVARRFTVRMVGRWRATKVCSKRISCTATARPSAASGA
jgi:hypothetical protein